MHTIRLHSRLLFFFVFIAFQSFLSSKIAAQVGCPGCNVSLPVLPSDTIYLGPAPNGVTGEYYNGDISFRMPKTTTPVNATDPSTPAGLPISNISIVAVVNVPPGLSWQPSQFSFNPSNLTDGCVKFCGTPLQPGLYIVEVFVTAEVLTINQSTSFDFPIYIAPASSATAGFSMLNNSGCGDVTVSFENNLPSNGNSGFSYLWDFGNGNTSTLENPPPVVYDTPGVFEVNYLANIDTFGYEVTTIRILDTGCDDLVINTAPDLYLKIKNPLGNTIVTTNVQDNASFPAIFNINLPLEDGIYDMEVRDEDTFGSEGCGHIFFTKTNAGMLASGDLEVQVDVIHPVQTVQSSGTVTVYAQPAAPVISPSGIVDLCEGEEVELVADYDQNIQWYQDTLVLFGEIFQQINVASEGQYWLEYTSPDGCKAQSPVVDINVVPLPNQPVFVVTGNEFSLSNPDQLPSNYSLQWYMDGNVLPGETGPVYCLMEPGLFLITLEVVDNTTGCRNQFSLGAAFNPAYTCASAANEISETATTLVISPNPTTGTIKADFVVKNPGQVSLQIFDSIGKIVWMKSFLTISTKVSHELMLDELASGVYFIKIQTGDGLISGRILKQ